MALRSVEISFHAVPSLSVDSVVAPQSSKNLNAFRIPVRHANCMEYVIMTYYDLINKSLHQFRVPVLGGNQQRAFTSPMATSSDSKGP